MTQQLTRLIKNYKNAKQSWECWCYMSNYGLINNDPKIRIKVENNKLLFHLRYLAMKDFYIEAYKILRQSRNNTDNIFYLLRDYIQKELPNKTFAEHCLANLEKHNLIIQRICELRDKYYAHLDSNYKSYLSDIQIKDVENCLKDIENSIMAITSDSDFENTNKEISLRNQLNFD